MYSGEKLNECMKEYVRKNPEYAEKNRENCKKYFSDKYKNDQEFRSKNNLACKERYARIKAEKLASILSN